MGTCNYNCPVLIYTWSLVRVLIRQVSDHCPDEFRTIVQTKVRKCRNVVPDDHMHGVSLAIRPCCKHRQKSFLEHHSSHSGYVFFFLLKHHFCRRRDLTYFSLLDFNIKNINWRNDNETKKIVSKVDDKGQLFVEQTNNRKIWLDIAIDPKNWFCPSSTCIKMGLLDSVTKLMLILVSLAGKSTNSMRINFSKTITKALTCDWIETLVIMFSCSS